MDTRMSKPHQQHNVNILCFTVGFLSSTTISPPRPPPRHNFALNSTSKFCIIDNVKIYTSLIYGQRYVLNIFFAEMNLCLHCKGILVAVQSRACTVFDLPNTLVMCRNYTWGMDVLDGYFFYLCLVLSREKRSDIPIPLVCSTRCLIL